MRFFFDFRDSSRLLDIFKSDPIQGVLLLVFTIIIIAVISAAVSIFSNRKK